jgi:hypothetical protein
MVGSRPTGTSIATGTGIRAGSASTAARSPPRGEDRRQDAVRQLAQFGGGTLGLVERLADERAGIAVPSLQRTTRQLERDDRAQPVSIWCGIGFASASVHVATKREPRAIATAKTSAVRRDVDQRDMFRRSGSGARSGH